MEKILIATDYSITASNALNYAAHLAQKTNAQLIIFNVYKLSIHASNSMATTSTINHLYDNSKNQLLKLVEETKKNYDINVIGELGKDDTIEGLEKYTTNNPVDIVVMGIESDLIEYKIFGNTTTAAIKLMKFPLLVVPNNISFNDIKNVTFAAAPSYLSDNCNLLPLKNLVKIFNARLDIVHILTNNSFEKNQDLEDKLSLMLKGIEYKFYYVKNVNIGEGIKESVSLLNSNLLVMIHHKIGILESIIKGSHSNQMTVNSPLPLLVIPN